MADLFVDPITLRNVAATLATQTWPSDEIPTFPADVLPPGVGAASNLQQNAETLDGFQAVAEAQCEYLQRTFNTVAEAYERVDANESTRIGEPGRAAAVDAIPVPKSSAQLPAIPDGPSLTGLDGGGYSSVEQTQTALHGGDDGRSLKDAATAYAARGKAMGERAEQRYPTNWEGDAADAACTRLNEYSAWLHQLELAWGRLASAATKLADAHKSAADAHDVIAWLYKEAKHQRDQLRAQNDPALNNAIHVWEGQMSRAQKASDTLREQYAQTATFDAVKPSDPPFGTRGGGGSTGGGGNGGASGAGGGGGGGGPTGGASGASGATMPDSAGIQNAAQTSGAGETGGSGSGGESSGGGGSQSGGGSPSGAGEGATGGLPGGLPDGDTGMPTLPDDPSLHPASASEGGGGSGGGGGGGLGPSPLQPNLGGSAVGTSPAGVGAGGGGGPAGASASGGMGGMAGGAPMHGAGHGQGGATEKKRNPALSPDENIYTEEREWTEPVIGQRRRTVADTSKDSK